jgi:hypothetical protein
MFDMPIALLNAAELSYEQFVDEHLGPNVPALVQVRSSSVSDVLGRGDWWLVKRNTQRQCQLMRARLE